MSDRFRGKEGRADGIRAILHAPESQTLMLLSSEPDTIVFPSGEKATELITLLCALLFSLFSSSVAVWEGGASKWEQVRFDREGPFLAVTHPNPRL